MKGVADGNGTFLASTAENWTHLTTSHGTQGGRGESHVAEGIVGISIKICRNGDLASFYREGHVLCLEFVATLSQSPHVFPLSSSKWELLSPKEKILLRKKKDDGEFW